MALINLCYDIKFDVCGLDDDWITGYYVGQFAFCIHRLSMLKIKNEGSGSNPWKWQSCCRNKRTNLGCHSCHGSWRYTFDTPSCSISIGWSTDVGSSTLWDGHPVRFLCQAETTAVLEPVSHWRETTAFKTRTNDIATFFLDGHVFVWDSPNWHSVHRP